MATYLIGDLQGCDRAFERLLEQISFEASRDRLVVLGDAVNRGPGSAACLRRLMRLGPAAQCLLGNHDLHLLAVSEGVRRAHRSDTLQDVLDAPDRDELLDWVRRRPLALLDQGWLLVHAGVMPSWTVPQTLRLADEVQTHLRGDSLREFLSDLFGNQPAAWSDELRGAERWRVTVNALTRLRYIDTRDASIDFHCKQAPGSAPPELLPWFAVPGRASLGTPIAFGHWSSLGLSWSHGALCLDSGCLWGGSLSCVRLEATPRPWLDLVQVACPCERRPAAADA